MNRREFRKRRIENDKEHLDIIRRECNIWERRLEYDMAIKHKDTLKEMMEMAIKLVKIEIKDLLKNKEV